MSSKADFDIKLREKRTLINDTLKYLLASQQIDSNLMEALKYTLQSPGKRVRSALVLWACELISGAINHDAKMAAAAIEMVHTYSLVHDDLPAMDNDDYRRGMLSCHKRFDEATAILTGDALLTLAFEILAKEIRSPATAVRLISELATAAGPAGMIAGQMADMKFTMEKASKQIEEHLEYIHIHKTAKMFSAAACMGGICGDANEKQLQCLRRYGLKIGLSFQIADDILDVTATSSQLGKTAGKDAKAGKITYPAVVGLEKSKQLAQKLADEAIDALVSFGEKADILRQLAVKLLQRTK